VGFIFAVPDLKQAERGRPIDTVIVKTLAVLPERANAGLGSLLLATCQCTASRLGYARAIHALMHEQNISRSLSRRYAQPMRHYALFGRALGAQP
jgi:GNAT superfamily N-acetyltransferase